MVTSGKMGRVARLRTMPHAAGKMMTCGGSRELAHFPDLDTTHLDEDEQADFDENKLLCDALPDHASDALRVGVPRTLEVDCACKRHAGISESDAQHPSKGVVGVGHLLPMSGDPEEGALEEGQGDWRGFGDSCGGVWEGWCGFDGGGGDENTGRGKEGGTNAADGVGQRAAGRRDARCEVGECDFGREGEDVEEGVEDGVRDGAHGAEGKADQANSVGGCDGSTEAERDPEDSA